MFGKEWHLHIIRIRLHLPVNTLVRGWYSLAVRCFNPKMLLMISKNLIVCYEEVGIPYGKIPRCYERSAVCVTIVFEVGTARDSLEYCSVMITMNWLPMLAFGNMLSISMAITSGGPWLGGVAVVTFMLLWNLCGVVCAVEDIVHLCVQSFCHVLTLYLVSHGVIHSAFYKVSNEPRVVICI